MLPFLPMVALLSVAHAQSFPAVPVSGVVYDGAHLLSPQQAAAIDALSREFRHDTGAPIVVATLPSLDAFGAKPMGVERYAGALFDRWRIGSRAHDGGILLVVAKADRKARIELGRDWERRYDAKARTIMQGTILPAFKGGDYGGGIVKGCQALAHLADERAAPTADEPSPEATSMEMDDVPPDAGASTGTIEPILVGIVLFGLAVVVLMRLAIVRAFRRVGGMGAPSDGSFRRGRGYRGGTVYPVDPTTEDDAYAAGFIAGSLASPPMDAPLPFVDPTPSYDPGPSFDSSPGFDSGGGADDGGSSDSGSFDSGSSGGGGDTGGW